MKGNQATKVTKNWVQDKNSTNFLLSINRHLVNGDFELAVLGLGVDKVEVEDDVVDAAVGRRDVAAAAVAREVLDGHLTVQVLTAAQVALKK